jgi:hypothetical protein
MKTNIHLWSHLTQFFLEWEMFRTKIAEEIKTHISHSIKSYPPPRKSCHLYDNVEKHCRAEQATDENIVHVHCILDT